VRRDFLNAVLRTPVPNLPFLTHWDITWGTNLSHSGKLSPPQVSDFEHLERAYMDLIAQPIETIVDGKGEFGGHRAG
jgi:hypothetical protein